MAELDKKGVYACALAMPSPNSPICAEWVEEIARHVESNKKDQIYLVGHSLGVPAILRYLERTKAKNIKGAVLVSGPAFRVGGKKISNFLTKPFDFKSIKPKVKRFVVIHGDDDKLVPFVHGKILTKELGGKLAVVKNGGHLNSSAGWYTLPQCLNGLVRMMA